MLAKVFVNHGTNILYTFWNNLPNVLESRKGEWMGEFKKKFTEIIPSSSHYDRNADSLTFKGDYTIKRTVAIAITH